MSPPAPDLALAERLFREIAAATADPPGVTRAAYGEGEAAAHRLVAEAARAARLEIRTDAAMNLYATLPGADRTLPAWILGSHLDSVPHGGDYDGTAGVLAGLAVAAGAAQAGAVPARDVTVMAIRAEETPWFPGSYLGSRAALGRIDAADLALRRSDSGRTLAEHIAEAGGDPQALLAGPPALPRARVHGFVELHIEQGPVLAAERLPLAIVTGIAGSLRHRQARILGDWAHSGAAPRGHRRDAVPAFAEIVARMERAWAETEAAGEAATVTFGQVATDPALHAVSKVPGALAFSLEIRSAEPAGLDRLGRAAERAAAEVAEARGVAVDLGPSTRSTPAALDPGLRRRLLAAAAEEGLPAREMPSGAGHDAAAFAHAGVPSAMVFLRNTHGSHCPEEAMEMADFAAGARLLSRLLFAEARAG